MESRYARQEVLPFIGKQGQGKLRKACIAIVGCGALGSVAAELLCRAGVGKLVLIDHDVVETTNLQRQALYTNDDVGKSKATALAMHLEKINPDVSIIARPQHLDAQSLSLLYGVDCILDGTDTVDTRFLINAYAKKKNLPWVYGGAIADRGLVYVITKDKPCFACVFPMIKQGESCEEYGILNSTSHIVASLQVLECIKLLLGKQPTEGIIHINALIPKIEIFGVKRNPSCKACKGTFSLLQDNKTTESMKTSAHKTASYAFTIQKCKTRAGWSVKPVRQTKLNFAHLKRKFSVVLDTPILLVIRKEGVPGEIIVHNYGEILFKKLSDQKKMRTIAAEIYETATEQKTFPRSEA